MRDPAVDEKLTGLEERSMRDEPIAGVGSAEPEASAERHVVEHGANRRAIAIAVVLLALVVGATVVVSRPTSGDGTPQASIASSAKTFNSVVTPKAQTAPPTHQPVATSSKPGGISLVPTENPCVVAEPGSPVPGLRDVTASFTPLTPQPGALLPDFMSILRLDPSKDSPVITPVPGTGNLFLVEGPGGTATGWPTAYVQWNRNTGTAQREFAMRGCIPSTA